MQITTLGHGHRPHGRAPLSFVARINEALALRTLKLRRRGKNRPRAGDAIKRLVPLLDPAFAQLAHEYLATVKLAKSAPIWSVTNQTVRN